MAGLLLWRLVTAGESMPGRHLDSIKYAEYVKRGVSTVCSAPPTKSFKHTSDLDVMYLEQHGTQQQCSENGLLRPVVPKLFFPDGPPSWTKNIFTHTQSPTQWGRRKAKTHVAYSKTIGLQPKLREKSALTFKNLHKPQSNSNRQTFLFQYCYILKKRKSKYMY